MKKWLGHSIAVVGLLLVGCTTDCVPCKKECPVGQSPKKCTTYFLFIKFDDPCVCQSEKGGSLPPQPPLPVEACTLPEPPKQMQLVHVQLSGKYFSQDDTFEIGDLLCNTCLGTVVVPKNGLTSVSACWNGSEATIKTRRSGNVTWTQFNVFDLSEPVYPD